MSLEALVYAKRLRADPQGVPLTGPEKLILLLIADYVNDANGNAWPSFTRLAEDACMARSATIRVVERLRNRNLIHIEHSIDGSSNHYRLPGVAVMFPQPPRGRPGPKPRVVSPREEVVSQEHLLVSQEHPITTRELPRTTTTLAPEAEAPAQEGPQSTETGAPATKPQDLHWDALEAIFGPCRTKSERAVRNAACKQFREGGVTPEEMFRARDNWPRLFNKGTTLTPMALAKYVGRLLVAPSPNGNGHHHAPAQQEAPLPAVQPTMAKADRDSFQAFKAAAAKKGLAERLRQIGGAP